MRRKWLTIWRVGVGLLVVELVVYGMLQVFSFGCRSLAWRQFNAGVNNEKRQVEEIPYAELINYWSEQAGISPELVAAVIYAESSFQPKAVSPAGARGLMQIMPDTWQVINKEIQACKFHHNGKCTTACYEDAGMNIHIGTVYLGRLLERYNQNAVWALAAYNAGPAAVEKYQGIPPFTETQSYVQRIILYWFDIHKADSLLYEMGMRELDSVYHYIRGMMAVTLSLVACALWRLVKEYRSWHWY
ncbi:hypothetical protein P22_2553 [Propionispora sp. 2/2-37]|uniref:lytic transglycosylase domain-containing protein n=1 Tax=Propionispora sp. 2/2-37 TaxID=1677858 RepID=UPI0006BB7966|nr:lytic transglycosylase domain-containing protein [Propionispora sp. 2/2-37]CUH96463.1 hypothetical protein P22_2553 [Propionispora sp. 2/2-37]